MNFAARPKNDERRGLPHQVVQKVFGDVHPGNGACWTPFLDKAVYAQLRQPDNVTNAPDVIVAFFNTEDFGGGQVGGCIAVNTGDDHAVDAKVAAVWRGVIKGGLEEGPRRAGRLGDSRRRGGRPRT